MLQAVPTASMSGRVRDVGSSTTPASTPLFRVALGKISYREGRRTFTQHVSAPVDSAGNYQMQNVNPGEYYLRAEVPLSSVATYYPGTRDVDTATVITVGAGQQIVGIDFDLNGVPTFRISGRVLNLPPATGTGVIPSILGFTFTTTDRRSVDPSAGPLVQNAGVASNGEFAINLPAGEWDIFPVIPRRTGSTPAVTAGDPSYVTGRARVLLTDRNVEDVVITVGSADIKGRIVVSGNLVSDIGGSPVRAILVPKDNYPSPLVQHLRPAQASTGSSGEFSFTSVPPGRYAFQILPVLWDHHVADIRVGMKSIYEDNILIVGTEPIDPIEVVLSRGGGTVRTTTTGPVAVSMENSFVKRIVLVPADRRENGLLYRNAVAEGGPTSIGSVAPGRYKVFAFQELPPGGAEQDLEFMKPYESFGVTVAVVAGQTIDVQVPWIPIGK